MDISGSTLQRNFKVGTDRLYGLNKPRFASQGPIEGQHYRYDEVDQHSVVTMDRINDRLGLSSALGSWQLPAPSTVPHETDRDFVRFLASKEGLGKTFGGRDQNARVRRAVKLGLDYTIEEQQGTVHFELEKIKAEHVVAKENIHESGWKDVTGSELRYLYRNRGRLGKGVQFYRKGEPAQAPWDEAPDLWNRYQPKQTQHNWPTLPRNDEDDTDSVVQQLSERSSLDLSDSDTARRGRLGRLRAAVKDKCTGCRCSVQ